MCGKYKKCIFPCKSEDEFRILAEECLTFETVTSCLAQRLRSHVLAGLWAVSPSCTFSPDFKIAGEDVFRRGQLFHSRQILCRVFFELQAELHTFSQELADSVQIFLRTPVSSGVVRILQGRAPDCCLYRVSALLFSVLLFFGYVNNFRPS